MKNYVPFSLIAVHLPPDSPFRSKQYALRRARDRAFPAAHKPYGLKGESYFDSQQVIDWASTFSMVFPANFKALVTALTAHAQRNEGGAKTKKKRRVN
jgi:hypothetical protein